MRSGSQLPRAPSASHHRGRAGWPRSARQTAAAGVAEAAEPLIKEIVALATAETYHLMGAQKAAVEAVLPLVARSESTDPVVRR